MNDKRKRMRFTTPSWAAGSRSCKARLVAAPRQFLQHDRMLWRRNKTQSSPMRRSILDEYSLLKDLWKGLSVECNRHLVPAKGFGLVERVVGFSDRRAQVALLQRSDPESAARAPPPRPPDTPPGGEGENPPPPNSARQDRPAASHCADDWRR